MAVLFLDIYDGDAPNGSILTTLTDADVSQWEMRLGENDLGSALFTIRRDHPEATSANLAAGNYVKVRIPIIDTDPVFGFWLDEHDDTILATGEEGGEYLKRGGPGILFILAHARLLDQFYNGPLGGAARGNFDVPGYWTWTTEPYGAIMVRLIEEGQYQPGEPLGEVSIDWTRTLDSDGNPWSDVDEEIQFQIGTDGLTVFQRLVESGEVFVRPSPDLTVRAFSTRGVDRSSASFGAGKVRFVKGVNIMTELVRSGHGTGAATHAIVIGKDQTYRQVVAPWYSSGTGRWTTVNYGETNDPTLLDKVGDEALLRRDASQEAIEFEFRAGDDEANGRYLPFKHFDTGDLVTIDTGDGEWDYGDATHRIVGFRVVLGPASDDTDAESAARSFRWVAELNVGTGGSYTNDSASKTGQPCGCATGIRLCHDTAIAPGEGSLYIGQDNAFWPESEIYVNGTALAISGTHAATDLDTRIEIPDGLLVAGENVIAVGILNGHEPISWIGGNPTGLTLRAYVGTDDSGPAIAYTSTATKVWDIENAAGTLGGEPSGWEGAAFDDSGWGGAADVGPYPYFGGDGFDVLLPPTAPALWIASPAAASSAASGSLFDEYIRSLKWLARITFTVGVSTSIVGGPSATSGDSVRAAPCNHDHAYTSAQISHGSGTVADALDAETGAPTTADYLVGTAHAGLSAEIVVGTSPGGELGGTWASPTVDATHSGSSHAGVQAAAEATAAGALAAHTGDTTDAHDASAVSLLDTGGYFTATDVEAALAELAAAGSLSGIWRPVMAFDGTNWFVVVDGSGTAVMAR